MSLNIEMVSKLRRRHDGYTGQCPACAEQGHDRKGEHLKIWNDGHYRCIMDPDGAGSAHSSRIFALIGIRGANPERRNSSIQPPRSAASSKRPSLPPLTPLRIEHMEQFAAVRGWQCLGGLGQAKLRGFGHYCEVWDVNERQPTILLTDSSRRNVELRRLDGQLWACIEKKVRTLPDVDPNWPIGAADIGVHPVIGLCEGGPDFIALMLCGVLEGIFNFAPVFMTGASKRISKDALPRFRGKRVRIFVHQDEAGRDAGERWKDQLYLAGASKVDGFSFEGLRLPAGRPIKDLADYATLIRSDDESITDAFRNID